MTTHTFVCANCFEEVERPKVNGPTRCCSRACAAEYASRKAWAQRQAKSRVKDLKKGVELCKLSTSNSQGALTEQVTEPRRGRENTSTVADAAGGFRLPPEFLRFRVDENRWYYSSIAGQIPITPGDGRWVLHAPGGRVVPWEQGQWAPVGASWISKIHARGYSDLWQAKLANPARVAHTPDASTDEWDDAWFEAVAGWGADSVFQAKPGFDVKLVESNGRGADVFEKTQTRAENEIMIALAGQVVTTTGGTGFANAGIHQSIRADLIQATADALAYTVNTQCIPIWVQTQFGDARLAEAPVVEWSVAPPKDQMADAQAKVTLAAALTTLSDALLKYGRELDVVPILEEAGLQTKLIASVPEVAP